MADFKQGYRVVRANEGGYANDPADRGGETYKGISRNNFPNWQGWNYVDKATQVTKNEERINLILEAQPELQKLVLQFYKVVFWDALRLDDIVNQEIGTEVFDTSVNMGKEVGANFLQSALNLHNNNQKEYPDIQVDGDIGPITIDLMNKHTRPKEVLKTLNILQGARYIEICKSNPKMEKFYRSWLSRVTL
jgi:lysozyme family protein